MAIKIIKEGKKEYYMTCHKCGCEFTYELEDINYNSSVKCPCCSDNLYHKRYNITITNPIDYIPTIPCINQNSTGEDSSNPCATCDWHKKIKGTTYIGDTPCTWCKYGHLTVSDVTATSTSVTKLD